MAWCRSGDRPLCEPMMVILPTHKCVSRPQWVNSLIPSEAYMHSLTRSSLVQVMPCRRFDTKTLTEPSLIYSQLNPGKYISMKFYLKFESFIHENAFQNSSTMLGSFILSWPQCVNSKQQRVGLTANNNMELSWQGNVFQIFGIWCGSSLLSSFVMLNKLLNKPLGDLKRRFVHENAMKLATRTPLPLNHVLCVEIPAHDYIWKSDNTN